MKLKQIALAFFYLIYFYLKNFLYFPKSDEKVMMGEVYIVKKEIIENPLNFLLLDFPEIFLGLSC